MNVLKSSMEIILVFFLLLIAEASSNSFLVNSDGSYCCRYASMNERCHDTCMQIFQTHDANFQRELEIRFPVSCPRRDRNLRDFWFCVDEQSDVNGTWVGQRCCEESVTDACRSACLQSHSKADLSHACRTDNENALFKCVFRQESKQRCCGRSKGVADPCRHLCERSFGRGKSGPDHQMINRVYLTCGDTMGRCLQDFTNATRRDSLARMPCCEQAPSRECRHSCRSILKSEYSDSRIVNRLIESCGELMPHEPMWQCFIRLLPPSDTPEASPPSLPEMLCCNKATSAECKRQCKEVYDRPWAEPKIWNQFQQYCEYNTKEIELRQCLEEVRSPCKMGCSDLSFCSNFNNRPTGLFRSCDAEGDAVAKQLYSDWTLGVIDLPNLPIPVKNVERCEPEKWKAVACALQIKPCSSRSGESIICKSDCLSLLNKCVDKDRLPHHVTVDTVCEMFSPSHLQSKCISISTFTNPGRLPQKVDVTQPCLPNPCDRGQVCVINRKRCDDINRCPLHSCVPGCKMGHGSTFIVPHGSLVRLPDPSRAEGCFQSCTCDKTGGLHNCNALPCTDAKKNCKLAGQIKSHGSHFDVDCNFCSCYGGNVTCTKRQCLTSESSVEDKRKFTGIPCNCLAYYAPVCGKNGRTYPNPCLATCLGVMTKDTTVGACSAKDPCHPNPCGHRERCVPTPRVCLTKIDMCQQFECIPRFRVCAKLLGNAISRIDGGAKTSMRSQRYRSENEEILSSSHFFSASAFLANNSRVCDAKNLQFNDICTLLRSKRRNFSYKGRCKISCSRGRASPVCGHDRVTYNHSCVAKAEGVMVDHLGACKGVSIRGKGAKTKAPDSAKTSSEDKEDVTGEEEACKDVVCPPLSNPQCKSIRPPGACCSLCAGLLRVMLSPAHLSAITDKAWTGPVTVRDILWLLRHQLNVLECDIYGQLTMEGDLALLVVANVDKPSLVQVDACSKEAERLSRLINSHNPTMTSYLILSPLTAATLSTYDQFSRGVTWRPTSSVFVTSLGLALAHWLARRFVVLAT